MRHVTWDCDGCGRIQRITFTTDTSFDSHYVPGQWQMVDHYLLCPTCYSPVHDEVVAAMRKLWEAK